MHPGRFPDFMIIGGMKCGTTSLHDYLALHPDVFMSETKEIHYFSDEVFHSKPVSWYTDQFRTDKAVAGTSPQSYTKRHLKYYQGIPERLKEHIPGLKFIYLLRDPFERYRSHRLENYYGETREEIHYNEQVDNYAQTSRYHFQLEAYLPYFPLDRFFITTLEELATDRMKVLNEIFAFLGVSQMEDSTLFDFVSNDYASKVLPLHIKTSVPYRALKTIAPFLAHRIDKSKWVRETFFSAKKEAIPPAEMDRLRALFSEDVAKLRALTGKSFSHWPV